MSRALVAHAHAAVDRDHRAGDIAGILRGQEADRPGDLLGGAHPLGRDEVQGARPGSARRAPGSSRCRCSRGDHVGGDAGLDSSREMERQAMPIRPALAAA